MALPTNEEQELLQLTNRFRADPAGEAARILAGTGWTAGEKAAINSAMTFFGVDTKLFTTQMAAFSPSAPLAWHVTLEEAAAGHSAAMIKADAQEHQLPGGPNLVARVEAAGYTGWAALGENIYAYSSSPAFAHAGFVVDWGPGVGGMQTPAGHRNSLANADFTEIGIDITNEANPATSVGPQVVTQNLGTRFASAPQFVGVVFDDADGDNFYDAGEGKGGISVKAVGVVGTFTTTTWGSGGWQMEVPAGSYTVTFSGGGMGSFTTKAVMGASNVALDAEAAQFSAPLPVASIGADRTVAESAVYVPFTVTLDVAPAAAASLRWSLADGTAKLADGDMLAGQTGTLKFAAGQTQASFMVMVNDEAHKDEDDESFTVVLDLPVGLTLGDDTAKVTLTDSFVPPPGVPLGLVNLVTKSSETPAFEPYSGKLSYLSGQFVYLGSDGISLSAAAPNVFLRSGSGDDALQVAAGQNVVDAGSGSNFLAGGVGADTFFLDARDPSLPIWSSVLNLTAGDGVTIWGVSEATHTLTWTEGKGAVGYEGLTLAATAAGRKDVLLTLTGLSEADRTGPGARFTLTSGFEPESKSDYLYLFALS